MKTILVPIDFSKNSETALLYAVSLANKTQAKIILLHAFHLNYTTAYVPEIMIEKDVQETVAHWNTALKKLYDGVSHHSKNTAEYISTENLAVDAILSIAKEKNADLIIMGTQGANKKAGAQLFGTHSSNVIEEASCPVMAVTEERIHNDVKKIVYATEFLKSDLHCLQSVVEIAKTFDAEIEIIHISLYEKESPEEKDRLEKFKQQVLKSNDYPKFSFKRIEGHSVEQKLESYAGDDEDADMLVMSAHHRNLKDRLFGRSISKAMSFYAKIPLLVFHHTRNKSNHVADKLIF